MKRSFDVVFLIPGFLGFELFGDFAYFADRVGAAVRGALTARYRRPISVVPVPIPPTGSLAERQLALGKTLVRRAGALAQNRGQELAGVHLIGHSTGGVDAQLLTLTQPLTDHRWDDFDGVDVEWLRARIKSVISIGSPHRGTCLASGPLSKALGSDSLLELIAHTPEALEAAAKLLISGVHSSLAIFRDEDTKTLLKGALASRETSRFFAEIVRSRALLHDLDPHTAETRYETLGPALPLLRRSFVTVAGMTPTVKDDVLTRVAALLWRSDKRGTAALSDAPPAPPDPLFHTLSELASGRDNGCSQRAPAAAIGLLRAAQSDPTKVIGRWPKQLPMEIDGAINDGVVNSARQLIAGDDRDELAAIVIADHLDVIGHYNRSMWVTDPKTGEESERPQIAGLLHSGSDFRDDQFFELIDRICEAMEPAFF
jgi:pimeloyl-ACP methyl ester carboxylesterase